MEPPQKRVHAFFDLQNLYLSAKQAWNISYPNFDPVALSRLITKSHEDWILIAISLYIGIHTIEKNPHWHNFWMRKLIFHKNSDSRVNIFTAPLHYNNNVAREKGIDIRIALDLVRTARLNKYDVALLFSRDSDFSEVAKEIREIAKERERWIKIVTVFPDHPCFNRGINGTDWLRLSKADYEKCLDYNNYTDYQTLDHNG